MCKKWKKDILKKWAKLGDVFITRFKTGLLHFEKILRI